MLAIMDQNCFYLSCMNGSDEEEEEEEEEDNNNTDTTTTTTENTYKALCSNQLTHCAVPTSYDKNHTNIHFKQTEHEIL